MNRISSSPLQFPFDPISSIKNFKQDQPQQQINTININNLNNNNNNNKSNQSLFNYKQENGTNEFFITRKLIPPPSLIIQNSIECSMFLNSINNLNYNYNSNNNNYINNNNNNIYNNNNNSNQRYSPYSKKIQTSQLINNNNNNNNNINNNNNNNKMNQQQNIQFFNTAAFQELRSIMLLEPVSPSSSASSSPRTDIFNSPSHSPDISNYTNNSNNNSNNVSNLIIQRSPSFDNSSSSSTSSSPISSPSFSSNYINIFTQQQANKQTVNISSNTTPNSSPIKNNNVNNKSSQQPQQQIQTTPTTQQPQFKPTELNNLSVYGELKSKSITPLTSFSCIFHNTIEYLTFEISKIRNFSSASTFYLGSRFPITFKTVESFIIVSLFINSHSLDRISDYWSTTQAKVFPGVSLIPKILSRNKYFEIKSSLSHVLSIGLLDNIQQILYSDIAKILKSNGSVASDNVDAANILKNLNNATNAANAATTTSTTAATTSNKFKTPVKHRNSTKELAAFNLILEYGLSNAIDIYTNNRQCFTTVPQFVETLTEQISSEENNNNSTNPTTSNTTATILNNTNNNNNILLQSNNNNKKKQSLVKI